MKKCIKTGKYYGKNRKIQYISCIAVDKMVKLWKDVFIWYYRHKELWDYDNRILINVIKHKE